MSSVSIQTNSVSQESPATAANGFQMLFVNFAILLLGVFVLIRGAISNSGLAIVCGVLLIPVAIIMFCGHFSLQPNEARVLILFGAYHGTVRQSGFYWASPFYSRVRARIPLGIESSREGSKHGAHATASHRYLGAKISLRARNFNSEKLKVNDRRGNPVEIAAVIVWRVQDTARAAFDVDDFENYVQIQSESAIRHIASLYGYDRTGDDDQEPTLRDSADEVSQALQRELHTRLEKAGLAVDEARLTHLAYAPEIAQAMLRRQQAEAIIAARKKIVHGAVSMVDMALRELSEKAVVEMDEERKAAMVSNLLVVLCGDKEITPVVNTGTLYN